MSVPPKGAAPTGTYDLTYVRFHSRLMSLRKASATTPP